MSFNFEVSQKINFWASRSFNYPTQTSKWIVFFWNSSTSKEVVGWDFDERMNAYTYVVKSLNPMVNQT